jgi:hypothetical protein
MATIDIIEFPGSRALAGGGAAFRSVLFPGDDAPDDVVPQPDFFVDLNLDQLIAAIVAERAGYNLDPYFRVPLTDLDAIRYRHEVMKDIERRAVRSCLDAFAEAMRTMRGHLETASKLRYPRQKQRWFLAAVEVYCEAVERLSDGLVAAEPGSRGLCGFRDYLSAYAKSEAFRMLQAEASSAAAALSSIAYNMLVQDSRIRVRKYGGETDYSADVLATFDRFKQGDTKDYSTEFKRYADMNHVEAAVLEMVARLFPQPFALIATFVASHAGYLDQAIARFDREIQFYIACREAFGRLEKADLGFCYPTVSSGSKAVLARDAFDAALAFKLVREGKAVITNDFRLSGRERIIIVSGPNQGGKTTFARMFGQLHYLARLGCPVPGSEARLFLFDQLFTHFERGENVEDRRGKLEDDLVRIHAILDRATPDSIVIMNEIFTSTSLKDAVFLSRKIVEEVMTLDALGVCVTFIDELAALGEKTVSMVSTIVPDNPAERTFKILRRPADGRAYAMAIARKYRLTYDDLAERLAS